MYPCIDLVFSKQAVLSNQNHQPDEIIEMDLFEAILLTATPISALIAVNLGRKVWIRYDIVATLLTTLTLVFYPQLFMPIIVYILFKGFKNISLKTLTLHQY